MVKHTSPNGPAVLAVYLIAFLQGLTLVSFPASSAVLKQMHGFTDAQYGAIFLPQVALAVLGAVAGGTLARRLGLQPLLWLAAAGNGLSQLALAASLWVMPALAFPTILLGTALLGWSFGLGGAPLNSYPPRFFPQRAPAAVVALHTLLGLGLMVGPLLADGFGRAGWWIGFPLSLLGLSGLLALLAATVRLPRDVGGETERRATLNPPLKSGAFWVFAAIAVLYAFAEGTFSNWAVIYLREAKALPAGVAALALSVFWGAMVAGRLLVAVLVVRIAPLTIWLMLPMLMIAAFLLLPAAIHASVGFGAVRTGGTGLLGLLSADHHPGLGAISRACGLGVVHADCRADGGRGSGFVRDRSVAGMASPGAPLPAFSSLSGRGPRAGSVADRFAAAGGGGSRYFPLGILRTFAMISTAVASVASGAGSMNYET